MFGRQTNCSLLVAVVLSIALHLAVLVPALMGAISSGSTDPEAANDDAETVELPPPPADLPELELGIDAQTPSTLTWVGYEEYQKHLAELAAIEQAAFTQSHAAAAPVVSITPSEPPALARAEQAQHDQAIETESVQMPPELVEASETDSVLPSVPVDSLPEFRASIEGTGPKPAEVSSATVEPALPKEETQSQIDPLQWLRSLLQTARSDAMAQAAAPPSSDSSKQSAVSAQQVPESEPGEISDKDSAPSSIIEVPRDQWMLGKPLAAHGLEIRPQRPQFTILTRLTAWPGNPLCEINFDCQGVPKSAKIIESSGDQRVDDDLLAALYRWRASGKPLTTIAGDETIAVRIRILFNRPRANSNS